MIINVVVRLVAIFVFVAMALIPLSPAWGEAQSLATPGVDADRVCHAMPISRELVDAFHTEPTMTPIPASPPATMPATRPTPDTLTRTQVAATVNEFIACLNTGDSRRLLSLFSERGLRDLLSTQTDAEIEALFAPSSPLPAEEQVELVAIRDPMILTVSGITVIFDVRPSVPHEPAIVIGLLLDLSLHEGRWLIDDFQSLGQVASAVIDG